MIKNIATAASTQSEAAVREVLHRVYAAWADNDADAFAALYTQDATSVLPGSYSDGKEAIRARMAAGFAGPLKGSTVVDEVRSVRFIGEDAAVVISRSGILPAGESTVPADRFVLATWVLAKAAGQGAGEGWLVAAYHNCPAGNA
ncbi:SgcJ/EcaC family oxidoreductase [Streptomyces yanii]|uniref:SgcJ/EcaC family oxidoreductase n=1 Tax=Streptomyces yanii TaxID=78510 RepID=A0ABV5RL34_9ACTN